MNESQWLDLKFILICWEQRDFLKKRIIAMEMLEGKKENAKVSKDKVTKSFGDLIRDYQREGYSNRESIEKAYSKMYDTDTPKKKKDEKV